MTTDPEIGRYSLTRTSDGPAYERLVL
jgi:hypothetical protein